MKKLETISEEYVRQNELLHKDPRGYGGGGFKRIPDILPIINQYDIKTILDYGAGEGTLKRDLDPLGFDVFNYDPAMPAYNKKPDKRFDLVVCTDVLEHIEGFYLDNVIEEIQSYAIRAAYLFIAYVPANKRLPDGRNTHLIQKPHHWWKKHLYRDEWSCVNDVEFPHGKGWFLMEKRR